MQRARELVQENGDSADEALFAACEEGDHSAVVCLVKKLGAEVSAMGGTSRTPLHIAAENAHIELIRVLERSSVQIPMHVTTNSLPPSTSPQGMAITM